MAKTLVLTEKPSVARDIARVLGCRQNGNGCIIGDKYIITWALGHLVTLADPEAYDNKYKTWRMEDLPEHKYKPYTYFDSPEFISFGKRKVRDKSKFVQFRNSTHQFLVVRQFRQGF